MIINNKEFFHYILLECPTKISLTYTFDDKNMVKNSNCVC